MAKLLVEDRYKEFMIGLFGYLGIARKIEVFAFSIENIQQPGFRAWG